MGSSTTISISACAPGSAASLTSTRLTPLSFITRRSAAPGSRTITTPPCSTANGETCSSPATRISTRTSPGTETISRPTPSRRGSSSPAGRRCGAQAVRNILIVKLDHIGDCVIAFPAVRRLKRHFPEARISVLTSRSSRSVWSLEPAIDEIFEFDFFHARSALGELEHSEADWLELRDRLARERFDLAVDLRKHPETRRVLQYTGACYLAGFDHRSQFTWLDVALDWGGDQAFARKRNHTGEDLVNLVDAIAAAADEDRTIIAAPPPPAKLAGLGRKATSAGPLICVHPTAGNAMKQWPVEYFAVLIDQLVENVSARVLLLGAPGEGEIADSLIARLRYPEAVSSQVGKLPLAELPALL